MFHGFGVQRSPRVFYFDEQTAPCEDKPEEKRLLETVVRSDRLEESMPVLGPVDRLVGPMAGLPGAGP